jgi:hypothetical protein
MAVVISEFGADNFGVSRGGFNGSECAVDQFAAIINRIPQCQPNDEFNRKKPTAKTLQGCQGESVILAKPGNVCLLGGCLARAAKQPGTQRERETSIRRASLQGLIAIA